jgi:hypothetical protein
MSIGWQFVKDVASRAIGITLGDERLAQGLLANCEYMICGRMHESLQSSLVNGEVRECET